jgi:hypothetical protein
VARAELIEYQERLFALYEEGDYQEGFKVAAEAARRFPEREGRTSFWLTVLRFETRPGL